MQMLNGECWGSPQTDNATIGITVNALLDIGFETDYLIDNNNAYSA